MSDAPLHAAVLTMVAAPATLLAALGIASLGRPLREAATALLTRLALLLALLAAVVALTAQLAAGGGPRVLAYGRWFTWGEDAFAFDLLADGLSLSFAVITIAICGIVAGFSHRYLHREPGYNRYFVLFAMFVTGITLVILAGSVEVLFAGWELLGLSSALLVGFFHDRRAPTDNALVVFGIYRVSDAAMLAGAVLLHHWAGSGSLVDLFAGRATALSFGQATVIAVLLLAAVAGKSALLPFSGWLPRAMEGPTPSSAVYYGALSIHAGCFLLLRAEPLIAQSALARSLAIAAGAGTALYATCVARVQTDVKSALAYASLTQVGIIVAEIGLGLTTLAFVHMVGHACFRLLQFLTAPNVLHDLHALEDAVGGHLRPGRRSEPGPIGRFAHLVALERGFVDDAAARFVLAPLRRFGSLLDRIDRFLCGQPWRRR